MKSKLFKRLGFPVIAAGLLVAFPAAVSLAAKESDDAPVYLNEPHVPPPPTKVRTTVRKQKYNDNSVRVEYEVVQLSDDTQMNEGKYVEYYRGGQKFQEGTFQDGAYAGQWTYWHSNGQVCKTITFTDGKPDGQWEVYRPDGTRLSRQSYTKGLRHGTWITSGKDGETPMLEVTYDQGKLHGKRVSYNDKGQKRQEMNFQNGLLHGVMIEWDDNGKKTAETVFENGKRSGPITRY
jgi:antitoxin component YwqK of YwqJK toxin-antitoxin module